MASSGTFSFSLSNAEIVLAAYERVQIRAPSLREEHWRTATRELNLLFSELSNRQINAFSVTQATVTLVEGTASYAIPAKTIVITDAVISQDYGETTQTDRYITPMSRTDYASVANKFTAGFPTSYYTSENLITLWPVPDQDGYTFNYFAALQMEDANIASGETPIAPYRWLDAVVSGLAFRVAISYAPQSAPQMMAAFERAWKFAAERDVEETNLKISVDMSPYFT